MNASLPSSSVFVALGYQVLSLEQGVYVLKKDVDDSRVVGLLLVSERLANVTLPAKLFLEPVPADVAAVDIVEHWQELDARRFEETGLVGTPLVLGPLLPDDIEDVTYDRPRGGSRFAQVLNTGDVVCFC